MNDTIRVGDKVRGIRSGNDWVVMGIDGDMAWLKSDGGEYTERFCKVLTRIEPEPVTLTPKYAVGQEVIGIGSGSRYRLEECAIAYYVGHGDGWLPERSLKPVPEPRPTCKGSGVASE